MKEGLGISKGEKNVSPWAWGQQIYKDVMPFRFDRIDLAQLAPAAGEEGGVFLDQMLAGQAVEVSDESFPGAESVLLHLYSESRNQKRLQGRSSLGLGFPLLIYREDNQPSVSPLFIWDLDLEPDHQQPGCWQFLGGDGPSLRLNHRLVRWAEHYRQGAGLEELMAVAGQLRPGRPDLEAAVGRLAEAWGLTLAGMAAELSPCPALEVVDEWSAEGRICWSGVIGIYPLNLPEKDNIALNQVFRSEPRQDDGHSFGHLPVDPSQASILHFLATERITIATGAAGTGKTHVLLQSLTNALSNGRKCLVVGPSLGELEEVQSRLSQMGLGHLALLLRDPTKDQALLAQILRAAADQPPSPPPFAEDDFSQTLDKCRREKSRLDETYRALRRNIFGSATWAEVVGKFLASNRREGKELLSGQLNVQDFSYRQEEYQQLLKAILDSQPLYRSINTLRHPLQNLQRDLFLEKNQQEAREYLTMQVDHFHKRFSRLHKEFLVAINDYSEKLTQHYDQWYFRLADQMEPLWEQINDQVHKFGRDFELTSLTSLRLYGSLLPKYRRMLQAKEDIFAAYRQLVRDYGEQAHFDFDFPSAREGRDLPRIRESLDDFRNKLSAWRETIPLIVQEETTRLSEKTVHPQLGFAETVLHLEEAMDQLLAELNAAGIYQTPLENKMLTIPRRRKLVEEIMEQLETTRVFMRDFDVFYHWQHHWLQLSDSARKIVRAIIKVKPADWLATFESWYFNTCLNSVYDPALPSRELPLRQFIFNYRQLQEMIPAQISNYWLNRRQSCLRDLRKNDRSLFQRLFVRKAGEEEPSLKELLGQTLEVITDFLPVLLVGPAMLEYLPEAGGRHFDFVGMTGGHALDAGQALPALRLGNRILITGNPGLLPLGPPQSLLQSAMNASLAARSLSFVHRMNPGNLFQLQDGSLIADHASGSRDYHFIQIDGHFDEPSETNRQEAEEVIRQLVEIKPTPQRTYPSVGIVTFSRAQRNLISGELLRIKQERRPGLEVIQQLERNGLGVFHVDETDGLHFETLILSPAFGPAGPRKPVTERIAMLNSPLGMARLKLLAGRPFHTLIILNSIPGKALEKYSQQMESSGTFFLANYFEYIKAQVHADHLRQEKARNQILLQMVDEQHATSSEPSAFLTEIVQSLRPYIAEERMLINKTEAHLRLPLKIEALTEQGTPTVVVPDGFFATTPATDYFWESNQQEQYRDQGYRLLPVWSVNWWKNAQLEARKVAGVIIEKDEPL